MKFEMPKDDRARLEQLLEYLGSRAEDFKKCFDIESEWCWKYADLMLRGLEKRELEYGEGHHIVPVSFYGKRGCSTSDDSNLTVLTYGEHLWAHYCLSFCTTGKMRGKMARAFILMYNIGLSGSKPLMPSEAELIDAIPELELKRILAMDPQWAKVEEEGRTHHSEDPKQYHKDWREANKGKIAEWGKTYYDANREKIAEKAKAWREANREKIAEQKKSYRETNKEKITKRMKAYRDANKEKLAEREKAWREANREKVLEQKKAYSEANKEKITERNKAYYEANKEKITKRMKAYHEANRENILEHKKAYYEANREKVLEQKKAWREANREKLAEYFKAWREAKKAAGYRDRKDPITGKHVLVFVGTPVTENAA